MQHMSMWQLGFLFLVGLSVLPHTRAITNEEKEKIFEGIDAGKELTVVLQQKDFSKVLKGLTETIVPWVEAVGLFGELLGIFLPEEDEMLNEMKKGFDEVNQRLDAIKDEITEVKEAIDWAVVKINFQGIETDIRFMDEKLKEVLQAPNSEHGTEEFIRVYESSYDQAGLKLYDAIVYHDQIFSENILTAGMKYIDYYRTKHQDFMRGLISLMMKASTIEISYEKFKEHDRGMTEIWKERLGECKEAMLKADTILEGKWKDLFRNEVNQLSESCEGCSNEQFKNIAYNFLVAKYYWRNWFVLIYDAVSGYDTHAIFHIPTYTHVMFRHHGRNFIIATSDSNMAFDRNKALSYIKDRACPGSLRDCQKDAAKKLVEMSPSHGLLRAAISRRFGWSILAQTARSAWGYSTISNSWWYSPFTMFYFG